MRGEKWSLRSWGHAALVVRPTSAKRKGLVNCVYKPCTTRMKLAGDIIRFQITYSWITSCGVSMLPEEYSQSVFTAPAVVEKMSYLSFFRFQDLPLLLKQWCVMWQISAMWVQCGGTWLVYAVHQTLPFFCRSGSGCETTALANLKTCLLHEKFIMSIL